MRRTRAGNRLKELVKEAMKSVRERAQVYVEAEDIQKEVTKNFSNIPDNWKQTAKNFVKAKLINEKII